MKLVRELKAAMFEKDALVVFKSEEFPISSMLFSCLSAKFKREFANRATRVVIDITADRDTVAEFVNACQLRECSITVDNALPLLSLAEDWEVPQLQEAVLEFIGRPENTDALLVPSLCRALSRDLDTSVFETQLRSQIPSLLDGDSLLQLPLPLLSRLLTPDSDSGSPVDVRRLFGFLVRCLDHFGPPASVLFSGIGVDELTPGELGRLESHRSFRWCFVSDSVGTSLLNLMGESSRARHQLLSESESQSVQIRSLTSRVDDLSSKLDRLSTEIRGRCRTAESQFESSIRDQTASIDSKLGAGLESLKSEMNSRLELRLREETESLKAGIETIIRNEIARVNSKFQSAIETQLSSTDSRFRTETANQSELTIRTLRGEIEQQNAATNSRLKSEIERQCAVVSSSIRTELQGEREWVRKATRFTHIPLRGSPLDGIIAFLERRSGGNVIEKGILSAGPGDDPKNAFDFHNLGSKYHHQTGNSEQWLAIDFKDMRIHVTDYSVQFHPHRICGPKSWFLEGSDDGDTWITLDTRTGRSQSQDTTQPSTFSVTTPQLCRHLRFRKTEGWHHGPCNNFGLVAIEFFGYISGFP
jgi:hypothetical protein